MNQHDPIVGRYVYVTCQGKTYRTYHEETGEGIPMVCLHTAGTDGRQYRHQMCDPDMAANFRMIAFDLPWHGKSIPPVRLVPDGRRVQADHQLLRRFHRSLLPRA